MNTEKKTILLNEQSQFDLLIALVNIEIEMCLIAIKEGIGTDQKRVTAGRSKIKWTGKLIWLVELTYALHTSGVINDGAIDIKGIIKLFENTFDVELKNFYNTFKDLRGLKKDRMPFLTKLRENLNKRMDELDK